MSQLSGTVVSLFVKDRGVEATVNNDCLSLLFHHLFPSIRIRSIQLMCTLCGRALYRSLADDLLSHLATFNGVRQCISAALGQPARTIRSLPPRERRPG